MVEAILEDQSQVAAIEVNASDKIHAGPQDDPGGITTDPDAGVLEQLQGAAGEASVDTVRVGRIVGGNLESRQDTRGIKAGLTQVTQDDGLGLRLRYRDGVGALATHDHRLGTPDRQHISSTSGQCRRFDLAQ